ncbi:hypothetical protein [Paenibacillus ginsengarvi]|uniref:hypothetical protein n=1 Tax=Paenibacillus ginsengarvi TaxID=400777 RepID=UPI001315970C|nr:hypothetical protein [Paenibacillus ginsengarvi]
MKATQMTADLSVLRQELERFISEAQNLRHVRTQPLSRYVGQLSDILRKHMDIGVEHS